MKKEVIVEQQYKENKEYYTGQYGMGFIVVNKKTGERVAALPTLAQAEEAYEELAAKADGKIYEIEDAGLSDSLYHKEDSPFRFRPI